MLQGTEAGIQLVLTVYLQCTEPGIQLVLTGYEAIIFFWYIPNT